MWECLVSPAWSKQTFNIWQYFTREKPDKMKKVVEFKRSVTYSSKKLRLKLLKISHLVFSVCGGDEGDGVDSP